jgi:hypothetical protein
VSQYGVPASALGHHFQSRYALRLLLEIAATDPLGSISVERLDDIVSTSGSGNIESVQTKQHGSDATLGNASTDVWKTIRAWLSTFDHPDEPSLYTLATTSVASPGSAAFCMRPDSRNVGEAVRLLLETAETSKNAANAATYAEFSALSGSQRLRFVSNIRVLDGSPPAAALTSSIYSLLAFAVDRKWISEFFLRLLGWWEDRLTAHLGADEQDVITAQELTDRVAFLREQFSTANLPIDDDIFNMAIPEQELAARLFMQQLHLIALPNSAMTIALREYYRAFVQRSRWVKDDLLFTDELPRYERRLREEWQRHFSLRQPALGVEASEETQREIGLEIYRSLTERDIRIRTNCSEPFIMRGSFHMLADELSIGWHPDFIERLKQLLPPRAVK